MGFTIVLATPARVGPPLIALLSLGEVIAIDSTDVRLALWPSSNTTKELEHFGVATMQFIHGGAAWHVRLRCERVKDELVEDGRQASFRCRVEDVLEDRVAYAELLDGIRFKLHDSEKVLVRWRSAHEQLRRIEPL